MRQNLTLDAERFLRHYGIATDTEGPNAHDGWIQVCCPFPDCGDTNFHGGFNLNDGHYNCWKCGWHPLPAVIKSLIGCGWAQAKQILETFQGKTGTITGRIKKPFIGAPSIVLPPGCGKLHGPYIEYLRNRGIDPDRAFEKYGLVASGNTGEYKFRVIAPITINGRLVSFQGRDITDKQKYKYKTCPKEIEVMHHKHITYNSDNSRGDTAIIVEGVYDVIAIGDGAEGTFGTNYLPEQAVFIASRHKRAFVMFDPEPKAQEIAQSLAIEIALCGAESYVVEKTDAGDPGSMSEDDIRALRKDIGL